MLRSLLLVLLLPVPSGLADETGPPAAAAAEALTHAVSADGRGVTFEALSLDSTVLLRGSCRRDGGGLRFLVLMAEPAGGRFPVLAFGIFRGSEEFLLATAAFRWDAAARGWQQEADLPPDFLDSFGAGDHLWLRLPDGGEATFALLGAAAARASMGAVCGL
jgi:hypothetical protein